MHLYLYSIQHLNGQAPDEQPHDHTLIFTPEYKTVFEDTDKQQQF